MIRDSKETTFAAGFVDFCCTFFYRVRVATGGEQRANIN
jgi:hypothetical protein